MCPLTSASAVISGLLCYIGTAGFDRRPLDPQSPLGHRWASPRRAHWALDQPAWDRLSLIYWSCWQSDGADLFVGRRLPELLRQAGLVDIGVEAKAEIYPAGHSRRTVGPDLVRSMRPKIVERGIANEQELDDLDQAIREHLNDPHTLVMPNFSSWRGAASR